MFLKQFGGKISKELIAQYEQSPNWRNGQFQNLEETDMSIGLLKMPVVIYKQLSQGNGKEPKQPIPIIPFDKSSFLAPSEEPKMIWYGHSVVLLRINGKTLLIDPMLGPNTTPIAPFPTRRFSENTLSLIDDFPEIDLVLLTHDHYDHLDFASIQKLKHKTKRFFVALGVKRHLVSWDITPDLITEFDWWQSRHLDDIEITFSPTRHFSGRGLTDRLKSLWGGWVFKTSTQRIWFSGDGGYGQHFKEIGQRLGPFDFAFMECGQYNDDWHDIHLFPDESVQAAIDGNARKAMPVHWAGFALSYQHQWQEPAEQFLQAAIAQNLPITLPAPGACFTPSDVKAVKWWTS